MNQPIRILGFFLLALVCVVSVYAQQVPARSTEYMVEMRDGVKLATTVVLPEGEGPWAAVLIRTPYNKAGYVNRHTRYTKEAYAYVVQDCRGRFASEGEYVPFETDMEDGYDTVEWIAKQAWCNGNVGMTGASAMGITSNLAAAAAPPHLKAAYVVVAPQSLFYESRFIGGVFKESHAGGWMRRQGVEDQIPALKKRVVMDEEWKRTDFVHHIDQVNIPIYNVGGWYDIFLQGNLLNFMYLQTHGRDGARGNQKLRMGPFGHGALSGDLAYPESGGLESGEDEIRWFDHWLKGIDTGIMKEPAVKYYMMASARKGDPSPKNRWITADSWPPKSSPVRLYLQEGFKLALSVPAQEESSTQYRFDPAHPVPTVGGQNLMDERGPMDQRAIGQRPDYLRFETDPLTEDVVVAGKLDVELWAATDGPDTDFMVKLVDVYPDGYEAIVIDCPIRTRYRHGRNPEEVKMMTPGVPEKLYIDLWSTALTFEKGHKIAVHVSSSNYPRFEVNPNTGEAPGESTMPARVATNTIYHDKERPSAIILPVVDPASEDSD